MDMKVKYRLLGIFAARMKKIYASSILFFYFKTIDGGIYISDNLYVNMWYMLADIKIKIGVVITNRVHDKVLLIKEKVKKKDKPLWNIIQGTYGDKENETILGAIVRECKEEALVDVEIKNSLGIYISADNTKFRVLFAVLAETTETMPTVPKKEDQDLREESIVEVKWFTRQEISNILEDEFISYRSFAVVQQWLRDEVYPLAVYKQVSLAV